MQLHRTSLSGLGGMEMPSFGSQAYYFCKNLESFTVIGMIFGRLSVVDEFLWQRNVYHPGANDRGTPECEAHKIKFKCLNLEASVGICFFKELKDPERERIYTNLRSKNVTAPSLCWSVWLSVKSTFRWRRPSSQKLLGRTAAPPKRGCYF